MPAGWYIDEDLLDVYFTLKTARSKQSDVHGPVCKCVICPERGRGDTVWLPLLAERDWAIITHDGFRRPGERAAVRDYGLGVFRLTWRRTIPKWERICLAINKWSKMEELWLSERRPFIITIPRHGSPQRAL